MNLLEIMSNFSNHIKMRGWEETTAAFTGKRFLKLSKTGKYHFAQSVSFYQYEITYIANGKMQSAWHTFYPVADPETEDIQGETMQICYNKRRPWNYKIVDGENECF
ncbi:MAG: hypothetical protein PUD03_05245 [Lachnospiraceae bacterium]|nr:hypothetical protein [Lachnospiraceae bacterium]MDD5853482.1 hypothetical protein [Lachnospiraceae bacterium]